MSCSRHGAILGQRGSDELFLSRRDRSRVRRFGRKTRRSTDADRPFYDGLLRWVRFSRTWETRSTASFSTSHTSSRASAPLPDPMPATQYWQVDIVPRSKWIRDGRSRPPTLKQALDGLQATVEQLVSNVSRHDAAIDIEQIRMELRPPIRGLRRLSSIHCALEMSKLTLRVEDGRAMVLSNVVFIADCRPAVNPCHINVSSVRAVFAEASLNSTSFVMCLDNYVREF